MASSRDLSFRAGDLNEDERTIMQGAMDMKVKTAREVMTPLEDAYMLEESCKLSFAVVRDIFDHGFSRVPVYARERQHVVGLLFVKDLIFVDPEDEVPLAEYLRVFERSIELVDAEANLDDVLRIFKRGRGHLALVLGQPRKSSMVESDCMSPLHGGEKSFIVGLVTLEDIIEEILGAYLRVPLLRDGFTSYLRVPSSRDGFTSLGRFVSENHGGGWFFWRF